MYWGGATGVYSRTRLELGFVFKLSVHGSAFFCGCIWGVFLRGVLFRGRVSFSSKVSPASGKVRFLKLSLIRF